MRGWVGRFALFWGSQTISRFGGAFSGFALIWWVAQTYGTATSLATGVMISMLPGILLGPLIGTIVDRNNRKFFIILSEVVQAVCAGALFVLAYYQMLEIWHLYTVMFINSLTGQFQYMAIMAATPMLVPTEHLQRVSGLSQLREGAVAIIAPPVGALMLEFIQLEGILLLEVGMSLVAALILLGIVVPNPPAKPVEEQVSVMADLRAGFRYVLGWPSLLALMSIAMVLNLLFNPAFALMPLLVKNVLQGGALQLAWLEMALGLGMIVGAVLLAAWGGFKRRIYTMALGVLGMGIGAIVLARIEADGLYVAIASMALFGLVQPLANGPILAIIQARVAPEMQGRVMGFMGSMAGAIAPLGLLLAGPISDRFGLQSWYFAAGVMSLLTVPLVLLWPLVRDIEVKSEK
jgi:DHA3 family macrolide efflux protein-like MFS transporter